MKRFIEGKSEARLPSLDLKRLLTLASSVTEIPYVHSIERGCSQP